MKIHVLDKKLANMIAAGEVVENPASVVKELVENSIDAGATKIVIEIEEGGLRRIEVTDNGSGIAKEDVRTAFLPHATSKIIAPHDLEGIETLGFRGEALASISTVSEVKLTTKTSGSDTATQIFLRGGDVVSETECAFTNGTKIEVKNLFFNTPARKKFLNKPKIEENAVTSVVERFMLSYPSIKFQYKVDGKVIYNTSGSGLLDNIYAIYGPEISEKLIEVNYTDGPYTLEGFTSLPEIAKNNSTYQISFLNGRMVKDIFMENAIMVAYEDCMMTGRYPVCFLNLKMPFDNVDVNVHPSKQEVKYENVREITTFFINALKDALDKANVARFSEIFKTPTIKEPSFLSLAEENSKEEERVNNLEELAKDFGKSYVKGEALRLSSSPQPLKNVFLPLIEDTNSNESKYEKLAELLDEIPVDLATERLDIPLKPAQKPSLSPFKPLHLKQEDFTSELDLPDYKVIGVAFLTYILIEHKDCVLVVDQHACHERLIYDKLLKDLANSSLVTQPLLFPYTFSVSTDEREFFLQHEKEFKNLGIQLEEFGRNTFRITEVPFLLHDLEFDDFIDAIKKNMKKFTVSTSDLLKEFLQKTACRSAVLAGDKLKPHEIKALLSDINKAKALRCPHGRPFVYELHKKDFEKWFKRTL